MSTTDCNCTACLDLERHDAMTQYREALARIIARAAVSACPECRDQCCPRRVDHRNKCKGEKP